MHFVALCHRYPQFKFVAPGLRDGVRRSALVKFEDGLLDTRNAGYSLEDADAIYSALKSMRSTPPLIGAHIDVRFAEQKETPNG